MPKTITTAAKKKPLSTIIYGPEGIGKTTFAAGADGVILCPTEPSSDFISGVPKFERDEIRTFEDIIEAANQVLSERKYKAFALDTIDAAHIYAREYIIRTQTTSNNESYDDAKYDEYARGEKLALNLCWKPLVRLFEKMIYEAGMEVILTAHAYAKEIDPPDREKYSKWQGKLANCCWGYLKEWADVVLFADFEIFVNKAKGFSKNKAVSEGGRICYTTNHPAREAKHRVGVSLPAVFPLGWSEYRAALISGDARKKETAAEIASYKITADQRKKLAEYLGVKKWTVDEIAKASEIRLDKTVNRLKVLAVEKETGSDNG